MKTHEPATDTAQASIRPPVTARPVQRASAGAGLPPLSLSALQSSAGNGAVVALLGVQRAALTPGTDPGFAHVASTVGRVAKSQRAHPPAKNAATDVAKAAAPPSNDKASKAAGEQVKTMDAQKAGEFDKAAFIAAVRKAIEAKSPKNLEDADEYAQSGKAGEVKAEVGGMVGAGKNAAAGPIAGATKAAPDEGKVPGKEVAPLKQESAGPAPAPVGGATAMPAPRPAADTDLSAGPVQVQGKMATAGVTEEQLAGSNEPQFAAALDSKRAAEVHSAAAPGAVRSQEKSVLDGARTGASGASGKVVAGMRGGRSAKLAAVNQKKAEAKAQSEKRQKEVADKVQAIFTATKTEVTAILEGLDAKVGAAFDTGEAEARKGFEDQVAKEMEAFRDKRYSGLDGAAAWLVDKLTSPPPEVGEIFTRARVAYLARMDGVISRVADIVAGELGRAKTRIATGKAEIAKYVAGLPKDLQAAGKGASEKAQADFDSLTSDIEAKEQGLVDDLAQRYTTAAGAIDARVEELKAENKGLIDKAADAIGGAIETILKLKDMLFGVFAKAAGVIDLIISKPIEFLGNLIAAVRGGLDNFVANIGAHLQAGLMGWLTGALGPAGITLPDKLDLRGIVSLVLQILGLTWANIRARIAKAVGEPLMAKIEQGVEIVRILIAEGPGGLWKWIVEKLNDLEEMVLGGIKDFVITGVIKAGVTWLIGLLNPAAAFIKACKAIYDIVMFFVERGSQIMEFVNSILDSVTSIATGAIGGAVSYIEQTLVKGLPVAISFLASLLGLDGIGEKVKAIIAKVQAPINKVLDGIIGGVVKTAKKVWGKIKGTFKGKEETPEQKQERLKKGLDSAASAVNRFAGKPLGPTILRPILMAIKLRHRLTSLSATVVEGRWQIDATVNPSGTVLTRAKAKIAKLDIEDVKKQIPAAQAALASTNALAGDKHHADATGVVVVAAAAGGGSAYETQGGGALRTANRTQPGPGAPKGSTPSKRWLDTRGGAVFGELGDIHERLFKKATKDGKPTDVYPIPLTLPAGASDAEKAADKQIDRPQIQRDIFEETGEYVPQPHHFDRGMKGGTGQWNIVHAEKQLFRAQPQMVAFGVNRDMCPDCQVYFREKALNGNRIFVAADPSGLRIFLPDGVVYASVAEVEAAIKNAPKSAEPAVKV